MPPAAVEATAPACVMYTSGSTGHPKGVVVTHRGIVRLVTNTNYVTLGPGDRMAHLSNVCFDAATFELWGALLSGATLVVIPTEVVLSPLALSTAIAEERLTTMFLTASVFAQVARERPAAFAGMRDVLFGGEAADPDAVRRVLEAGPPGRLINGYGPTEATTFACWYRVERSDRLTAGVPIGRPISNTTIYILDKHFAPVPVGVPGEIFIGGDGVARGYLNRPGLTAERFVPDPFAGRPGARLYRTGDVGRYRADGVVEFIGRLDEQVKLRGFRIEPGEIEAALRLHPDVSDCVVVAGVLGNGEKQLVAYVTLTPISLLAGRPEQAASAVRAFLRTTLPDYLVPALVIVLDRWPLTSTGKIDRGALKEAPIKTAKAEPAAGARDRIEAELIRLWGDLLQVSPIGIRDSFFDLGGHSLLAARMIDEVGRLVGRPLPLAGFFAEPTIESLARAVSELGDAGSQTIVTLRRDGAGAPFFFVHGDFNGRGMYCRHLVRAIGPNRPFHLVHPHGVDGGRVPATIESMAEDRLAAVRHLQPHGPYAIGGYCNGALVAFEMARRLAASGEDVERLVLIDPPAVGHNVVWLQRSVALLRACLPIDERRVLDWICRLREFRELPRSEQTRVLREKIQRPRGSAGAGATEDSDPTRDYLVAILAYAPQVYHGRMTLITSEGESAATVEEWRHLCDGVDLLSTPGTHQSCTTAHVGFLAERLRSCLATP